jgi:hypothetical protein
LVTKIFFFQEKRRKKITYVGTYVQMYRCTVHICDENASQQICPPIKLLFECFSDSKVFSARKLKNFLTPFRFFFSCHPAVPLLPVPLGSLHQGHEDGAGPQVAAALHSGQQHLLQPRYLSLAFKTLFASFKMTKFWLFLIVILNYFYALGYQTTRPICLVFNVKNFAKKFLTHHWPQVKKEAEEGAIIKGNCFY